MNKSASSDSNVLTWVYALLARHRVRDIKAYVITLTPELAAKLVKTRVNRELRDSALVRYGYEMTGGHWVLNGEPIIISATGRMLNGFHRCNAVMASGVVIEVVVIEGIDDDAYDYLDQGVPRQGKDFLTDGKYKKERSASLMLVVAEERGLLRFPGNSDRMLPNEARAAEARHPGILASVEAVLPRHAVLPGKIAAYCHYRIMAHDPEKGPAFADAMTLGAGLPPDSPLLHLRNRAVSHRDTQRRYKDTALLAMSVKACTAYIRDQRMGVLKWSEDNAFPAWPSPLERIPRRSETGVSED